MADLTLGAVDLVEVTPVKSFLNVVIEGANVEDLLGAISLEEISDYFGDELVEFVKDKNDLVENV